jgi:peptidoglycan/xylan/chitin deacetylase (PgdA/CDA1 family)
VALTFDDGPSQWTPQVLEVLDRYDVSATFFVVGREADRRRDVLAEIAGAGHLVATHTWNHEPGPPGDAWPRSWIEAEMLTTQAVVREVTGADTCWFRPPRGALHGVANAAANWPLDVALWSVDTRDWKIQAGVEPAGDPAPGLAEQVLANAAPAEGERHPVVLLHDGGGYRGGTVAALPAVIELYRDLGYRFVRLDERERQGPGAEWG